MRIAFCPLEGREQMPPNIEENSRYLYLSFIFCFTFKIYIYIRNENGRVGNNRIRNFVIRKEAKVSDEDTEYLEY